MNPAPFYRRILALIYDSLLVMAILFVATFIALFVRQGQPFGPNHIGFILYLLFCAGLYIIWCWTHGGQTLGMKAWRLKIHSTKQARITYQQAIGRYLVGVLGFWSLGLGILWCLVDNQKQSLADRLSHTKVCLIN